MIGFRCCCSRTKQGSVQIPYRIVVESPQNIHQEHQTNVVIQQAPNLNVHSQPDLNAESSSQSPHSSDSIPLAPSYNVV